MLSCYAAPFDFNLNVAIVIRYLDLVRSEIDDTTTAHTLAVEVATVENVFRTRFAREGLDDARDLAHLYSNTSTTVS